MKKPIILFAILLVSAGILFFLLRKQNDEVALRIVAAQLQVDSAKIELRQFDLNDLGDHCVFFRIASPSNATIQKIRASTAEYFGKDSANPLVAYLPFRSVNTDFIANEDWWKPGLLGRDCEQWVSVWEKNYLVNLIFCDGILYGHMQNTYERKATPGPL